VKQLRHTHRAWRWAPPGRGRPSRAGPESATGSKKVPRSSGKSCGDNRAKTRLGCQCVCRGQDQACQEELGSGIAPGIGYLPGDGKRTSPGGDWGLGVGLTPQGPWPGPSCGKLGSALLQCQWGRN